MNNDDFFRVIDPENSRSLIPSNPYRTKSKPKQKQKPEAKLQKQIIAWLEKQKIIVHRINSGVFKGASGHMVRGANSGTSDLLICYRGRFIAIEVKDEGEQPTDKQQRYINRVNASGGLAFVAYSLNDVKQRLAEV